MISLCIRDGWHLRADGRTCRDIDECGAGARPCGGGECRNTPGSYVCTCADGLLPSPDGAKPTCQDIDECADVSSMLFYVFLFEVTYSMISYNFYTTTSSVTFTVCLRIYSVKTSA